MATGRRPSVRPTTSAGQAIITQASGTTSGTPSSCGPSVPV